ncbi:uncharacterized protein LOC114521554 isoform X2 [Dendronephthya gigantea]|nr:uncharacterized protein LOC114521554 isoform X2 [Dendronephthya gigantea]
MTVDCSSQRPENHSIVSGRQAKQKDAKGKEISKVENDSKRKPRVDGVDEGEPKKKIARQDKNFDGKDLSCGVITRSNLRPGKRTRTQTPERSPSVTPESSKSGNKQLETGCTRKKRQWESWASKEKDCFFEALIEHSKDFDKIQTYLKKRRGDLSAAVRNKDQVRHFYYRTLNKISKYIPEPQDPSDAKKTHHEVRSLICYGELRKKFRSWKEKDGKKLTELISSGKTTIRYHGRNVNIRAPTCRVLKKLNTNATEDQEQVPQKIMIELVPRDNQTWSMVQSLAHNPRLRTVVSARKTLSSLMSFLLCKWKLQDNIDISLSAHVNQSCSKNVASKTNNSEAIPKGKQGNEANEVSSNTDEVSRSTETSKDKVCKASGKSDVVISSVKTTSNSPPQTENVADAKHNGEDKHDALNQETWSRSNSGSLMIADIYRKMNNPRKILLGYSMCQCEPKKETNYALEQLVKLATGEYRFNNKKETVNMASSKPKDTTVIESKATKVSKPRSTAKTQKPLAPKPPQEVIIPTVVSPIINQVSTNSSSKSGNHRAFSFTPINSFQRPSPILPKSRKRQSSRVVIQRTLLPRPYAPVVGPSAKTISPLPSVPSPTGLVNQNCLTNPEVKNKPRRILPKETNISNGESCSSAATISSTEHLSVDSLIKLAMGQDIPENLESLILPNSLNLDKSSSDISHVRTEEIDRGVASGHAQKTVKDVQNLNDAIKHLECTKQDHVQPTDDLLDNLKSSEDEDPLTFLSPSHLSNFPPEGWLNEESTDFSLGTLFSQLETSPVKQKPSSVLDTPKKAGAASDSDSKYNQAAPMFCDIMDENSVDYVKKFRDLAKKMGNDHESSSSDNVDSLPSSTISFKSLLSESSKD